MAPVQATAPPPASVPGRLPFPGDGPTVGLSEPAAVVVGRDDNVEVGPDDLGGAVDGAEVEGVVVGALVAGTVPRDGSVVSGRPGPRDRAPWRLGRGTGSLAPGE